MNNYYWQSWVPAPRHPGAFFGNCDSQHVVRWYRVNGQIRLIWG